MNDQKPIYVCSEAFLRCAPWTPIAFRLQRNKIVKTKPGEEQNLLQAIKCLEAFGVHSDIHSVCAHLRTFKGSEIAKRVFCNLRDWPGREPCRLPAAVDLSVGVEGHSDAYRAKRIFKGLLGVFLSLCKKLISDDQSREQRLKETFIDVFEGFSPLNFTLEPENYRNRREEKNRSVSYWIHIVRISHGNFVQNYEKMTNDLAFLAPRHFGMFTEGYRYRRKNQNCILPAAFRGFELNTELRDTRDWVAMMAAKVFYNEKPALETVLSDDESTRLHEASKRKKRELVGFSAIEEEEDDENDLIPLKMVVRREKNVLTEDELVLTLQGDIMDSRSATSLESSRIMPETSFQENGFNLDRNETNREKRHSRDHDEVTTTFVDPRPSSSREKDKPVTSRQGKQLSTAVLEEQPSILQEEEQLMFEQTSSQGENIISLQTEQRQTRKNIGSCEISYADGAQQENTIPQSPWDASSEGETVVSTTQISGTTVTSDASTVRVTRPPSFDTHLHQILDMAWQSPDVRRAVNSCIVKMIEQKCKDMV